MRSGESRLRAAWPSCSSIGPRRRRWNAALDSSASRGWFNGPRRSVLLFRAKQPFRQISWEIRRQGLQTKQNQRTFLEFRRHGMFLFVAYLRGFRVRFEHVTMHAVYLPATSSPTCLSSACVRFLGRRRSKAATQSCRPPSLPVNDAEPLHTRKTPPWRLSRKTYNHASFLQIHASNCREKAVSDDSSGKPPLKEATQKE